MRSARLCALLCALLLCLPGCMPPQEARAELARAAASSTYETAPLDWLEQKSAADRPREELSEAEKEQLSLLAMGILYTDTFFHAEELSKPNILWVLYTYFQDTLYYDEKTDRDEVRPGLAYPPDSLHPLVPDVFQVCVSAQNADAFMQDILGTDIPGGAADFGDPDEEDRVSCRDGVYYISPGDPEYFYLTLRAYQPLGDGVFYLFFDADDRNFSGGDENRIGYLPNYYSLLVTRSDSAWGFTVKAKLKEGNDSLLPADFPLPLYAA